MHELTRNARKGRKKTGRARRTLLDANFLISRWRQGEGSASANWLNANGDLVLGISWVVKRSICNTSTIH